MKVAGGVNRMIMGRSLRMLGFGKWKEMVQRVCGQEVWLCSRKKKWKKVVWKRRAPERKKKENDFFQRDREEEVDGSKKRKSIVAWREEEGAFQEVRLRFSEISPFFRDI